MADKFDPDAYLKKTSDFDPDAYLMQTPAERAPEQPVVPEKHLPVGDASIKSSALSGFGQGASFGFSDELAGLVEAAAAAPTQGAVAIGKTTPGRAALRALIPEMRGASNEEVDAAVEQAGDEASNLVFGAPLRDVGYRHGRDVARREQTQSMRSHPVVNAAGMLAGGLTVPGPKSTAVTRAGQLGHAAKTGAIMGATGGAGVSNADLLDGDTLGAIGDIATSAGVGATLGPLMRVGGDKLSRWLRTQSKDSALKALGLRAGISNQLTKRGYESADDARELGQAALDMELIRPGRTASDVAERAQLAKEIQGARISAALADADAKGIPFDADEAAWEAAMRAAGPVGLSPTAAREATRAGNLVDDVLALPKSQSGATFEGANRLKSDMYQGINYGVDPALKTQLERKVASGLRSSVEDQMARVAGPDVADELRAANRAYGFLSDIEPLAQDEATRQLGRKALTPLDIASAMGGGGAGTLAGGPLGGALGATAVIGTKLLGPRIPSTVAVGARALSPRIEDFMQRGARAGENTVLRPSLSEQEQDSIDAFLKNG